MATGNRLPWRVQKTLKYHQGEQDKLSLRKLDNAPQSVVSQFPEFRCSLTRSMKDDSSRLEATELIRRLKGVNVEIVQN